MSDMLDIIKESAEKIFKDFSVKDVRDQNQRKWQADFWKVINDAGLTSIGILEAKGGAGGDSTDAFQVLRLAKKYAVPLPISETLLTNWLLAEYGAEILNSVSTLYIDSGNKFAIQEQNHRLIANGRAVHIPWGRHAEKILLLGNYNGNSVLALLPVNDAVIKEDDNLAGEPVDILHFDHTKVEDARIYEIDEQQVLDKVKLLGGLVQAAKITGTLEKVLELSIQYVQEREQFGRPLHRFQAVQQHMAAMAGEVAAASAMTTQAIEVYGKDHYKQEIASAKIKANEAAGRVAESAHQIHGAIGATDEHSLHQFTKRLWMWREVFGNENDWAEEMAHQFIRSSDKNIWEMIADR